MKAVLSRIHTRLGDLWRYVFLLFTAARCGDLIMRQRLSEVDSAAFYMISRFAEIGTKRALQVAIVDYSTRGSVLHWWG